MNVAQTAPKRRANFLTPQQTWALNQACRPIAEVYGPHIYHVGSSLTTKDYRDVDVRCMLPDEVFAELFPDDPPDRTTWTIYVSRLAFLNSVISEHLSHATGLPVDFQFQQQTQANIDNPGARMRNPLGIVFQDNR